MSSVLQATTVSVEAATNYARSKVQGERKPDERVLTLDSINHNVKTAEYAVRGAIALRAEELRVKTQKGDTKDLNFKEVVSCNIGNPQQLGQTPITFFRQVAALCECPDLLDNPLAPKLFAQDAIDRAREYIKAIGSVGAYSHSKGVPLIRQYVADFLEERDGHKADPEKIYLTAGASAGVSNIMQLMIASPNDGVMIPIPQYPLYTAALALNNAQPIRYYLQEEKQWSPDVEGLKQVISEARASGILPKAICVISPGNPVGNVLSQEAIADILKFAYNERLVVLADEVYQTNIYHPSQKPFVSFRKVLRSLGEPYSSSVELVSFHSISKGQVGECGRRGGYFEIENFDPKVEEQIYKLASIQLCPPLQGQIAMGNLIRPPRKGDVSYDEYTKEVDDIQKTLAKRSDVLHKAFSELEGVDCQPAEGALYLFPQLKLPAKAQKAASEQGKSVDAMYCMDLLNETGICVVAGSGFGQEANTFHFRTTVLAPGTEDFVQRLKEFHNDFLHNTFEQSIRSSGANTPRRDIARKSRRGLCMQLRTLLVGLGNGDKQYTATRHSLGRYALHELRAMLDMPAMRYDRTLGGTHSSLMIGGRQLTLYEARSFMNVCGPSIAKAVKRFEPDHLIVMHDDLDVAPGMLKYSKAGGTRGHNGLRSLDATLKSPRRELIRLGIGRPSSGSVADYVLSSLGHTEAGDFAYDAVTRQPGAALEQLWQVIQDAMASASAQKEAHAK